MRYRWLKMIPTLLLGGILLNSQMVVNAQEPVVGSSIHEFVLPQTNSGVALLEPTGAVIQQGVQGTVKWQIFSNGLLYFSPNSGSVGTFNNMSSGATTRPWSSYNASYTQVRFARGVNGGKNVSYMFNGSNADIVDLTNFNTSNVTDMSSMFNNSKATSIKFGDGWDTSNVTNMRSMFNGSQSTSLDLSMFKTHNVTDMSFMFQGSKATSLDLSMFKTHNVTNMNYMFSGSQATSIKFGTGWGTSNVTIMSSMFSRSSATSLDLSMFKTHNVTNMQSMFSGSRATSIKFGAGWGTSNVTDMSSMFSDSQATSLDLSMFNTSNVTNMQSMFSRSKATSIKFGAGWDTSNVTSMSYMFTNSSATSLDLSMFKTHNVKIMIHMFNSSQATSIKFGAGWDTSNVTNMFHMFYNSQATSLDLSMFKTHNVNRMYSMFSESKATSIKFGAGWDTSNVTDMSSMFNNSSATSLDLSMFKTHNVTNMKSMFSGSQATSIKFGAGWDTSNVTSMSSMFSSSQATSLDLSMFNTIAVTSMSSMFSGSKATSIKFGAGWDTSNVTSMQQMFLDSSATSLDLSMFNTRNVKGMRLMFRGSQATSIKFGTGWDTSNVTDMTEMFSRSSATSLDLSMFKTHNVTNMKSMFSGSQATSIKFGGGWDTSNVTSMSHMFSSSLATSLDLSMFKTHNVTDMSSMFATNKATSINFGAGWDTSNVTSMSYMFTNSSATSLDLSMFNTSNVTRMDSMFMGSQATSLDLSMFNTSNVTNMNFMFSNSKATSIKFGAGWDTSNVTDMQAMFYNSRATSLDLSMFKTHNVKSMNDIFRDSYVERLDLTGWDVRNVIDFSYMFHNMVGLKYLDISTWVNDLYKRNRGMGNSFDGAFNFKVLEEIRLSPNLVISPSSYRFQVSLDTKEPFTQEWERDDKVYRMSTLYKLFAEYSKDPTLYAGTWKRAKQNPNYEIAYFMDGVELNIARVKGEVAKPLLIPENTNIAKFNHDLVGWKMTVGNKAVVNIPLNHVIPANTVKGGELVKLEPVWRVKSNIYTINNGELVIDLKPNEVLTFPNLPAGASYEVYEETALGWTLIGAKNNTGSIAANKTSQAVFYNQYNPRQTSAQLLGYKYLDSNLAGGYRFNLIDRTGRIVQTVESLSNGAISFSPLLFTQVGTYTYTIKEVGTYANITNDTHTETVRVVVTDDGKGNLVSEVQYDSDGVVFYNTSNKGNLVITKRVNGTDPNNSVFTIGVSLNDGEEVLYQVRANERIVLNDIKAGTTYSIRELNIPVGYTLSGISNSRGVVSKNQTTNATVTNTYNTYGAVNISATKVLTGRDLVEGEFTFQLLENGRVIATAVNDEFGNIVFPIYTFNTAGRKQLVIREVAGATSDGKGTMVYDTRDEVVVVNVRDIGQGMLEGVVIYDDRDDIGAVFNNRYTPNPVVTVLEREFSVEVPLPFKTYRRINYKLDLGEIRVVQEGELGSITNTELWEVNESGGKIRLIRRYDPVRKEPKDRIIEFNPGPIVTPIPYDRIIIKSATMWDDDDPNVVQTGEVGESIVYKDDRGIYRRSVRLEPKNEVVMIGTRASRKYYTYTEELILPYNRIVREDPTKSILTTYVLRRGTTGIKIMEYVQHLYRGELDGAPKGKVKHITPAIDEIIIRGTGAFQ